MKLLAPVDLWGFFNIINLKIMDYKVNQKVWHIQINNAVDEKSYRKNGVKIEELKIIGISKYKICLNNDWFTTLSHKEKGSRKDNYTTYLNDPTVSIRTRNNILGDGVFVDLYSTEKPTKRILKKWLHPLLIK